MSLSRGREAEEASFAFQGALASLGLSTIEDAQSLWDDLPIDSKPATANRWLDTAVKYILSRRLEARALAIAYYRLTRALRTGSTILDPYEPNPGPTVSMGELRAEFKRLVDSANASLGHEPTAGETEEPIEKAPDLDVPREPVKTDFNTPDANRNLPDQDEEVGDDEQVDQEALDLKGQLVSNELAAEAEAKELLQNLGINNEKVKLAQEAKKKNPKLTPQQIHDAVGNRQAATAGRLVMNGARGTVYAAGDRDDAVQGWVRVSSTGTPCGWCAMLISRGPVYKSSKSAGGKQNLDTSREAGANEFHDGDYCYALPVYSDKEYNTSPRFALNRKYAAEWKTVTAGLGGDAAISKWRKHIRNSKA